MEENNKASYEELHIGGADYKTLFTEKYRNHKPYSRVKIKELRAFIPGTISDVSIKEGDKVNQGDILMVLEAMKMKNRITAPLNASVKSILVKNGEVVKKDQLLVVLK